MMGQQTRSESLFYYFRTEDHIPDDHLLRVVDRHVDFAFVRETSKTSYSHTGRPSFDPEVLLRTLLIGYLYGITGSAPLHLLQESARSFSGVGALPRPLRASRPAVHKRKPSEGHWLIRFMNQPKEPVTRMA